MTVAALRALLDGPTSESVDTDARLEDLEFMLANGEGLRAAARRLGISPDGLEKWLDNNDAKPLKARLRALDPIANPTYTQKKGGSFR